MQEDYEFLTEKEQMWAQMLLEVLQDHQIPYATVPVYGAGLVLKAGAQERLRIFVPGEAQSRAEELMEELFPEENRN